MDENKQILDAAKALGISEIVPEIYRDMLQPAARQIGNGLAIIAKTVMISLAPLEAGIWGYEKIKEWLLVKVTRILAERKTTKIISPPSSIAGPLVFQLIFAKDEPELKELYASLLASSMDANNISAHPSFVTIIQQLTSDEAKILKYISQLGQYPASLSEYETAEGCAYESVSSNFKKWCEEAGVMHTNKSDTYMDNLVRLRIFSFVTHGDFKFDPYDCDTAFPWKEYAKLELTSFGQQFLDACIEKSAPNQTLNSDG